MWFLIINIRFMFLYWSGPCLVSKVTPEEKSQWHYVNRYSDELRVWGVLTLPKRLD